MCVNSDKEPLPLPRLIVRLGGLGNRNFGTDNNVAEDPGFLQSQAEIACAQVLEEVETALLEINLDAPEERGLNSPQVWQTHGLALIFGKEDRWNLEHHQQTRPSVFAAEKPLVSVLTGDAKGGDTIIRELALSRPKYNGGTVDYEHLWVTTDDPASVSNGLGVGKPAAKDVGIELKMGAKTLLTREEAHTQANIVRKRAYAYRAQSEALRHHSDLLLTIWDPDAEGKTGGTSESVEAALRERIPVISICLAGKEQPEIRVLETICHLHSLQGRSNAHPSTEWKTELRRVLHYLLSFPDSAARNEDSDQEPPSAYQPRIAFTAFRKDEPLLPIWPGRLWEMFDAFSQRLGIVWAHHREKDPVKRAYLAKKLTKTREWLVAVGLKLRESSKPRPLPTRNLPSAKSVGSEQEFYQFYDRVRKRAASGGMSGIYGEAHRGGIILSYLLAAVAVMLAVIGGILHAHHSLEFYQAAIAAAEVMTIVCMFALSVCSTTEGWNAAYTDTRILAEALRMMRFLAPLGVHTPLPRLPYHLQNTEDPATPDRLWSIWYFRALVRMAPLRLGKLDLEAARKQIDQEANLAQSQYHYINAAKQKLLEHGIETTQQALFFIVVITALLHFIDALFEWEVRWMFEIGLVVCIGGPALIAALHGFASQIETKRLKLRSSSMERLLGVRSDALNKMVLAPADEAQAVWGLATEALITSSLLMDETAEWSTLYRHATIHRG